MLGPALGDPNDRRESDRSLGINVWARVVPDVIGCREPRFSGCQRAISSTGGDSAGAGAEKPASMPAVKITRERPDA